MSDVDFLGLKALKAVVETGSINAAARHLQWSKSSLSRRLSALESTLGEVLIQRTASGAELTHAGDIYFHYARQMLVLAEEGERALMAHADQPEGELILRVSRDFSRGWIGKGIASFVEKYPRVSIDMIPTDYVRHIDKHEGDLWIWVGEEPNSNLRYESLGVLEQRIYTSVKNHQQYAIKKPEDLSACPWVLSPIDDGSVELISGGNKKVVNLSGSRLRLDSLSGVLDRIVFGQGVAILPRRYADCKVHGFPDQLINVLPEWRAPDLPVGLMTHFGPKKKAVTMLVEHLKQATPADWHQS